MGMFESHLPCCGADVESWVASRYLILYCTIGRKNVRVCASGELQPRTGDGPHSTVRRQIARMCVLRYDHADTYARITENDAALLKYGRVTHGAPDRTQHTTHPGPPDPTRPTTQSRRARRETKESESTHGTPRQTQNQRHEPGPGSPRRAPLPSGSARVDHSTLL